MVREDPSEALAGERIGRPLSLVVNKVPGADTISNVEDNTSERVIASAQQPGRIGEPGMSGRFLCGNREVSSSAVALCISAGFSARIGKVRSRSR